MDEGLGKALMLEATERMGQVLRMLHRFDLLSWEEVIDLVTTCIWKEEVQAKMLREIRQYQKANVSRPGLVPNLEDELRRFIPQSFHNADRLGGVSGIGSIVVQDQEKLIPWGAYNPDLLIANFREGGFGRGTGPPGSGKTNNGCVVMERWMNDSKRHHAITNISIPLDGHDRLHYAKDDYGLFRAISGLGPKDRWLLVLDEGGLIYDRSHDATTMRAAQLDKFARMVRKLKGNLIILEQFEASVPRVLVEFSSMVFRCYRPGVLNLVLKAGTPTSRMALDIMPKEFPRTELPFNSYDPAFFKVHPKTIEHILEAITDERDVGAAIGRYLKLAEEEAKGD